MEGLQLIQCRQSNLTRFDDSTILSFKQFLSEREGDAKIQSMRQAIFNFISLELAKALPNPDTLVRNFKKQINSIFHYVKEVRQQLLSKVQSHQALLKRYEQIDINYKKLKTRFQSVHKDASLMSQKLRKLKDEKINLEKKCSEKDTKIAEIQKELRLQQNSKQALLKISLKQTKNGLFSSKNLSANQNNIAKPTSSKLKVFKSQKNLIDKNRSNLQQEQNDDEFIGVSKGKSSQKNQEESFSVQDLLAQMNDQRGQMVKSVQFGNLEKKTQKLVPLPTTNVIRKKSN